MQKLLVSRRDCRKRAAQFHSIALDEVIWTKPNPAFHCFQIAGIWIRIMMFKQSAFVKFLEDCRTRLECCERAVDSLFPLRVRKIASERDATTAPAER